MLVQLELLQKQSVPDVQSHFQPLCCFSFLLIFVAGHMLEWCLCTLTVAKSTNESYS